VHAHNYSDLPIWDIVFGTFKNPKEWSGQAGFYEGGSRRLGDMLLGHDVSGTEADRTAEGVQALAGGST
jgi:sterol desaturase/sphingolipid hydroxylase (fatty acid hydroxylase superfamily)